MRFYDIIIAGAGPAGLSIASKLSKDFKVLVLDKNKIPFTTAIWYSYADRVKKYGLEKAIANKCHSLYYRAVKEEHTMKDCCVVLDRNKALNIWKQEAVKNKATIKPKTSLKGFTRNSDNTINVQTSKETYKTKLLIDCTGINSPILKKHKLVKNLNSWLCYGFVLENVKVDPDQIKFYPTLDKHNTYIGIHPHSKNKVDFYIFRCLKKLCKPEILRKQWESVKKDYFSKGKKIAPIQGPLVSGELRKYALDNIAFFGEASMFVPPGCGAGFNQIMMKHADFAENIKATMLKNKLNAKSLKKALFKIINKETMALQRVMEYFSYYFNKCDERYDGGVRWLNALGPDSKYWMRNELSLEWIKKATLALHGAIKLRVTFKLIPKREFFFIFCKLMQFLYYAILSSIIKPFKKKN
jgi:flavin-dependent dehydrogenase